MKKTLSILLALMMLMSVIPLGIISASAAVKTTDPAFTDNYVLLEYIWNTDKQYIKTGYNAGAKVTVSMDLQITAWAKWSSIFGARTASGAADSFVVSRYGTYLYKLCAEIGKSTTYPATALNSRHMLTVSGNDTFSGEGLELCLFGINENGKCSPCGSVYKLYSCKITDDGKVVRDFVPAKRKADGAVGLFDLQNGVFYESESGKSFERPPVKTTDAEFTDNFVQLEYIQNTNGQYIKTGYNAGAKVTVSMNLEITEWKYKWGAIFGSRTATYSTDSFIACQDEGKNCLRAEIGTGTYHYENVKANTISSVSVSGTEQFTGTGLELYLFKINGYGLTPAIYKLYSCKITDGGKVVRNFLPARRKEDNAVGLYDLQNGVFYGSASGTGFAMTEEHQHHYETAPDEIVVERTCTTEGKAICHCVCGNDTRELTLPAAHVYGRDGKCLYCGAKFSPADKTVSSWLYDEYYVFSGAESITVKIPYLPSRTHINIMDKFGNPLYNVAGERLGLNNINVTVPGDAIRIYSALGTFTVESVTPNYPGAANGNNTASVLSEGNMWIVIVVAVLVVLGVAALFILKKKKKLVPAGGASTEDDE